MATFKKNNRCRPFKDFYFDWADHLRSSLLPLLRSSPTPTTLSTQVDLIHAHFQSYYAALSAAARHDVFQVLHPEWRSPLEHPLLFLGDLHPNLLTNPLRSLLPAWPNNPPPSPALLKRLEEIERGLRLMVPCLVARSREARERFVEEGLTAEAAGALEEEMGMVFADANRLRVSALAEMVREMDARQAVAYPVALAQVAVGLGDPASVRRFERRRFARARSGAVLDSCGLGFLGLAFFGVVFVLSACDNTNNIGIVKQHFTHPLPSAIFESLFDWYMFIGLL